VIGLAAGTIPAQLRHFYPEGLSVTGVEIDPAVVDLGRRHFGMPSDSTWLDTQVADGRVFLGRLAKPGSYDLVIVDAFAQEYYIPFHLATEEAFREAKALLRPGGILAMNVAAVGPDSPLLRAIEATLVSAFGNGYRVRVLGYSSFVLFAVKDGAPRLGRLRDTAPEGPPEWEELRGIARYMEWHTSAIRRSPDALVLTDDRAPVERLTDEGVSRESRSLLSE